MSVRKASHGTIFLIVSSGSPLALIASSRRSTSKKPFCPMTRSLHPPATAGGQRVRFAATWRDEFFEVPDNNWLAHSCGGPLVVCFHRQDNRNVDLRARVRHLRRLCVHLSARDGRLRQTASLVAPTAVALHLRRA